MANNIYSKLSLLILMFVLSTVVAQAENAAAVNEVLKLQKAGLSEDTLVAFVKSKNVDYELSSDNVIALRDKGLSAAVINAMLASGKNIWSPAPASATYTSAPPARPAPPPSQPQPPAPQVQTAPAQPIQPPPATNPDVAYFYQELSPYGRWLLAEDNHWYWQPTILVSTPAWRPYWDNGRWVHTDYGWYWASDYPWGWAVFHYGRWHLHPHFGWIWAPDRVWGPAWVVWRSGGDFCGWAPLPPAAVYDSVSAGFIYHGQHVTAGFDFGLDWAHFSFCYTSDLGGPLHARFHKPEEIRAVYHTTTVINNYTVVRTAGQEGRPHIVNHGVDPDRVGHKVETLKIEDVRTPNSKRSHEQIDTRKKTLQVYRPDLDSRRRRDR